MNEQLTSWKKNVAFETVKGVFIGAIAASTGITLANSLTSILDTREGSNCVAKEKGFKEILKSRTKATLPTTAIMGAVAGALYYRKEAKDFNKLLDEKWTIRIEKEDSPSNKSPIR